MEDLQNLKQRDKIEEYINKFQMIANQLEIPEKELVFLFTEGLNQEVRGLVLTQECKTLEEAIKYATRYQECFERNGGDRKDFVRKINYTRTLFPTKKGRGSFRPRKFDTSKKKAEFTKKIPEWNRKRVDPRDNRSKTIKCYKCGRSGHVIKDCRVRKGGAVIGVTELITEIEITNNGS
jgi:hypothetical protein